MAIPLANYSSPGIQKLIKVSRFAFPVYMVIRSSEKRNSKGEIWAELTNTEIEKMLNISKSRVSEAVKVLVEEGAVRRVGKMFFLGFEKNGFRQYIIHGNSKEFLIQSTPKSLSMVEKWNERSEYRNYPFSPSYSPSSVLSSRREDSTLNSSSESTRKSELVEERVFQAKFKSSYRTVRRKELADFYQSNQFIDLRTNGIDPAFFAGQFFYSHRQERKHYPSLRADHVIEGIKKSLRLFKNLYVDDFEEHGLNAQQLLSEMIQVGVEQKNRTGDYFEFFSAEVFNDSRIINQWGWYSKAIKRLLGKGKGGVQWKKQ